MNELSRKSSLTPEVFHQVDAICQDFEIQWQSGKRPAVGKFVSGIEAPIRSALLRELLLLDIEYRRKAGENPQAEDYLKNFPISDGELIQEIFGQSPTKNGVSMVKTQSFLLGTGESPKQPSKESHSTKHPQEVVSLTKFIDSLADCGLMSRDEVEDFINSLPDEQRPLDGKQLAEALYYHKKMTRFQVQAIYQGKTRGLVVGNYMVLDRLGSGGMGQVYKAQHRKMDRIVALKVLPSQFTKSDEMVKRFQREVKAAAKLSHPNIVTAFDADEYKEVHFLVMEYVEGKDLANVIKESGPLTVSQAVNCIIQAAQGLAYAHQQGIIHRDIKPQNLLLDKGKTIKVLDMGLARIEETVGSLDSKSEEGLTLSGQVMGTLDYMPPEQALDTRQADARADIYSLGCTLYFLLVGRPPYSGDTVTKKIIAHRELSIPSLRTARKDVPESLNLIFQQMLAKNPDDRQQSMSEVIAQLQQCKVAETPGQGRAIKSPAAHGETFGFPQHDVDPSTNQVELAGRTEKTQFDDLLKESVELTDRLLQPSGNIVKGFKNRRNIGIAIALGFVFLAAMLGIIVMMKTAEGTLVVEVNEPEAKVEVLDGEGKVEVTDKSGEGKMVFSLDPGKHRLKVQKEGFEFFAQDFTLEKSGEKIINVRLEKPTSIPGTLVVKVNEPNAMVEVLSEQGKIESMYRSGTTPISIELPVGKYKLSVLKDGFESYKKDLQVQADQKQTIDVTLNKSSDTGRKVEASDRQTAGVYNPSPTEGASALESAASRNIAVRPRIKNIPGSIPPQQQPVVTSQLPDAKRPSSPLLGYTLGDDSAKWMPEVASYTNFVFEHHWVLNEDARPQCQRTIDAARKLGLQVVISVCKKRNMDKFLEVGLDFVEANRDIVFAICIDGPTAHGISSDEAAAFSARVKQALPGIQVWILMGDKEDQFKYAIPSEVDHLVICYGNCTTPQDVSRKTEESLPFWSTKFEGRSILLLWDNYQKNTTGLVPNCQLETFRTFAEIVRSKHLAGLFFGAYGPLTWDNQKFIGIQSRPELVTEIKQIAHDWGIENRAEKAGSAKTAPAKPLLLGYDLGDDSARWMPEVVSHANCIWEPSWIFNEDARPQCQQTINTARRLGLRVVLGIGAKQNMDMFSEVGLDFVKANRDVVFAICASNPVYRKINSEDLATFGAKVKQALPGMQFWIQMMLDDKDQQKYLIPGEVDLLNLVYRFCITPQDVRRNTDESLPIWVQKSNGRPIILWWTSWQDNDTGLVPDCQPETFRTLADIVHSNHLAGLGFSSYGPSTWLHLRFMGIQSRPELVAEIKQIAHDWEIENQIENTESKKGTESATENIPRKTPFYVQPRADAGGTSGEQAYFNKDNDSLRFGNQFFEMRFSAQNGTLHSFIHKKSGVDLISEKVNCWHTLWGIGIYKKENKRNWTDNNRSSEFFNLMSAKVERNYNELKLHLYWDKIRLDDGPSHNGPSYPAQVHVTISVYDDLPFSVWGINIKNRGQHAIEKVSYPFFWGIKEIGSNGSDDCLIMPVLEGRPYHDPYRILKEVHYKYPSDIFNMRFAAYYDTSSGFYFACYDEQGTSKDFIFDRQENQPWGGMHFDNMPEGVQFGANFKLSCPVALGVFEGDWYTAADFYRQWAKNQSWAK